MSTDYREPYEPHQLLELALAEGPVRSCSSCDATSSLSYPTGDPGLSVITVEHDPNCPEYLAGNRASRRAKRRGVRRSFRRGHGGRA